MRPPRFHPALLLPPFLSLLIAGSVVRYQSVHNARVSRDLAQAKREISRLATMLPKGQTVTIEDADHDEHHDH